jgi:pimeloyl-ACP methyl ester carboxylesterase
MRRVKASIPDVEAIVIPGVGHALPVDPKADAGSRISDFLDRH